MTLCGATTPGWGELRSDGNEGLFHILQNSIISGASISDCLVSYPGHTLKTEMQSVYSTAPAGWTGMFLCVCVYAYV